MLKTMGTIPEIKEHSQLLANNPNNLILILREKFEVSMTMTIFK